MAVPLALFVRRMHKWLALTIGLQALLWTISGMYMVAVHIDYIHGDHLVRTPVELPHALEQLRSPAAVAAGLAGVESVRLSRLLDRPTYIVTTRSGAHLFDAMTGAKLSPITEATVRALARHWMAEDRAITRVALLERAPLEVQTRPVPLWRVDFEGWDKPAFYISPATGELLSRRHEAWRVFDVMWMLHIMDYDDRENVNNWLLRAMTWGAVVLALSGGWLLWWSFSRRKRQKVCA